MFGFSKDIIGGLHNLTDSSRDVRLRLHRHFLHISLTFSCVCVPAQAVFYPSGHTGVVYDYALKRQLLLQGHVRQILLCVFVVLECFVRPA